jgi:hypothetical protein
MSRGALISWKEECDTIHSEMDGLLTAVWPETAEGRQVRKIQFMALIERRNVSAQKFLKPSSETAKFAIGRREATDTPALPDPDPTTDLQVIRGEIPEERLEAGLAIDPDLDPFPADPRLGARNFLKFLGLERL